MLSSGPQDTWLRLDKHRSLVNIRYQISNGNLKIHQYGLSTKIYTYTEHVLPYSVVNYI